MVDANIVAMISIVFRGNVYLFRRSLIRQVVNIDQHVVRLIKDKENFRVITYRFLLSTGF